MVFMPRTKAKEYRKPFALRIRPTLMKATRKAARKMDVFHVDWVEEAFLDRLAKQPAPGLRLPSAER